MDGLFYVLRAHFYTYFKSTREFSENHIPGKGPLLIKCHAHRKDCSKRSTVVTWKKSNPHNVPDFFKQVTAISNGQEAFPVKKLSYMKSRVVNLRLNTVHSLFYLMPSATLILWAIKIAISNSFKFNIKWGPRSRVFSEAGFWAPTPLQVLS